MKKNIPLLREQKRNLTSVTLEEVINDHFYLFFWAVIKEPFLFPPFFRFKTWAINIRNFFPIKMGFYLILKNLKYILQLDIIKDKC